MYYSLSNLVKYDNLLNILFLIFLKMLQNEGIIKCSLYRWVNGVETEIAHVYERTQMYMSSLKSLKEQLNILQQTHNIPHLYLTAVAEVVRRRTFSQAFLMVIHNHVCNVLICKFAYRILK